MDWSAFWAEYGVTLISTLFTLVVTALGFVVVYIQSASKRVEASVGINIQQREIALENERFKLDFLKQQQAENTKNAQIIQKQSERITEYVMQIGDLKNQILNRRAEADNVLQELNTYKNKYAGDMAKKDQQYRELKTQLEEQRKRLDAISDDLIEERDARQRLQSERDELKTERDKSLQQIEALEIANKRLLEENEELRNAVKELREEIDELSKKLEDISKPKLDQGEYDERTVDE